MNRMLQALLTGYLSLLLLPQTFAEEALMVDNFESQPELRWRYFSDQVMGGVSEGRVDFEEQDGVPLAHMTGQVSTENNGGFIQVRRDIAKGTLNAASGVYVKVRGNGQQYFLHIRTSRTLMPWHYYGASFEVTEQWQTIKVPLSTFARSSRWFGKSINPSTLRSIGIVAFGRKHTADIEIAEVGFY